MSACDSWPAYEHIQGTVILVSEVGLEAVEEDREGQQVSPFPYRPNSSAVPELWPLSSEKVILLSVTYKKPSHVCGGEVTDSDITVQNISFHQKIRKKLCIQKTH